MYYVFIIFLIILIAPMLLCISFLLYIWQGAPIVFCQKRVGKNGKPFVMYKFRTMRVGAEREQKKYQKLNEANGPVFKIRNDPRLTRVGKFFAHTGLDELPQLFNVLKGDMALVGPRPLPVPEAQKLTAIQKQRESVKPGIISPWILEGYHRQTFDNWMKSDITYAKSKNFLSDLTLSVRTVVFLASLFFREISG
jgi:lipopolysaccharide/colanic/teichoic acid biosynthesis glycosyltransferase